jgi:hypothetical protein
MAALVASFYHFQLKLCFDVVFERDSSFVSFLAHRGKQPFGSAKG